MNPTEIANAFNNFCINIGPNLSKTILESSKSFKNFLKNTSLNSFLPKATSQDEVHKFISQLNKGKALGPLNILKDNVNILSTRPSFIITRSFKQGVFPESLKTDKSCQFTKRKTLSLLVTTALYLYCQFSEKY